MSENLSLFMQRKIAYDREASLPPFRRHLGEPELPGPRAYEQLRGLMADARLIGKWALKQDVHERVVSVYSSRLIGKPKLALRGWEIGRENLPVRGTTYEGMSTSDLVIATRGMHVNRTTIVNPDGLHQVMHTMHQQSGRNVRIVDVDPEFLGVPNPSSFNERSSASDLARIGAVLPLVVDGLSGFVRAHNLDG